MNRPPFRTRVEGHSVTVFVTGALLAFGVYAFFQNSDIWPMTAILGLMMHRVMQAHEAVIAYARWQAEWESLAPDRGGTGRRARRWPLVLTLGLFLTGFIMLQGDSDALAHAAFVAGPVALVLTLLAAAIAVPVLLGRWLWKRRRRARAGAFVVTVIARPSMQTPTLADAYKTLPPYCHALLRGQG